MGKDGTGLSDTQRKWLTIIFGIFTTVSAGIMALPEGDAIPKQAGTILTLIGSAVLVIMVNLGIRDATSSAIAKRIEPTSTNTRNIRDSVTNNKEDTPPTQ